MNYYGCRYTLRANAQREDVLWEPDQFHVSTPVHLKSRARVAFSDPLPLVFRTPYQRSVAPVGTRHPQNESRVQFSISGKPWVCEFVCQSNRSNDNYFNGKTGGATRHPAPKDGKHHSIRKKSRGYDFTSQSIRWDEGSHPKIFSGMIRGKRKYSPDMLPVRRRKPFLSCAGSLSHGWDELPVRKS